MTGADLSLLVNEAALTAARRGHTRVQREDFTDAIEKIILGAERAVVMSASDRERTAYHESGHALLGMLTPGADPVRKISIIPRGQALGVTLSTPEADRYGYEREELVGKIKVALGGRAAERVVYGQLTTGAESDIQQLTQIARGMVGRWGMSEAIGPVTVQASGATNPLLPGAQETSDATQRLVDEEVRRIIDDAEVEVVALLERERPRLEALARALLEKETLDQAEAYAVAQVAAARRARGRGAPPARRRDGGRGLAAPTPRRRPAPEPAPPPRPRARPEWGCPHRRGATRGVASPGVTTTATLGALLAERAQALAGRDREREALADLVRADRPIAAVVHGVAGVGKTALLEAFCADARAEGARLVRLDGRGVEPTQDGFVAALGAALGCAPTEAAVTAALAGDGDRVVLVVDACEALGMLDTWLARTFVPGLPVNARVLLAGRAAPSGAWTAAYGDALREVPLGGLAPADAERLLRDAGLDPDVNLLAHGHPLTLRLACSALRGRSQPAGDAGTDLGPLVDRLARLYLEGLDAPTWRALGAASVTRRMTMSLLGALLPEEPAWDAFERLRALPFVDLGPDGLVVHDTVRAAAATVLRAADPVTYARHRAVAWRTLHAELRRATGPDLWRYTADLLYLVDRPIVRQYFFPETVLDCVVEPARPGDWPAIAALAAARGRARHVARGGLVARGARGVRRRPPGRRRGRGLPVPGRPLAGAARHARRPGGGRRARAPAPRPRPARRHRAVPALHRHARGPRHALARPGGPPARPQAGVRRGPAGAPPVLRHRAGAGRGRRPVRPGPRLRPGARPVPEHPLRAPAGVQRLRPGLDRRLADGPGRARARHRARVAGRRRCSGGCAWTASRSTSRSSSSTCCATSSSARGARSPARSCCATCGATSGPAAATSSRWPSAACGASSARGRAP